MAIGPWKGVDNKRAAHAVHASNLRNAVNINLDNTGRASSREGVSRVYSGHDVHSVFYCPLGTYFVDAGSLRQLNDDYTATTLRGGVTGTVAWQYFNGVVYWMASNDCGRIDDSGLLHWGVEVPDAPTLSLTTGSLDEGRYLVYVVATTDADMAVGEESGASEAVAIDVTAGGGITVHCPTLAQTTYGRAYVTTANGSVYYYAGAFVSRGTLTITSVSGTTRATTPQYFHPPPLGCTSIRFNLGRVWLIDGNVVWYSDPYAFGRFRQQSNYLQFANTVSVFEPTDQGMWAIADQTFFLQGTDPDKLQWAQRLPYGAIAGTGAPVFIGSTLPHNRGVVWTSTRGVCLGTTDGQVINLQEADVALNPGDSGVAVVLERNGVRQYIVTYLPTGTSQFSDPAWRTSEAARRA